MKNQKTLALLTLAMLWLWACESTKKENTGTENLPFEVTLSPVTDSPEFMDASIELNSPGQEAVLPSGKVTFEYDITNYSLTAQTLDAAMKKCANSPDGQHIHLILNNQPYLALYNTTHEMDLPDGHYVALSFLSRSYHESLKNYGASVVRQFTVGDVEAKTVDLSTPHLFYSRPKGEYVGKDTERVLLDFYLLNTELSEDGNKVRAKINGKEFILTSWTPYMMHDLPMGENTVELELIDKEGNLIEGPFNQVKRTFTLKPE